jgi:hypothetical protein
MKCKVTDGWMVRHNGQLRHPGAVLDMSEADAERLVASGAVELVGKKKAAEPAPEPAPDGGQSPA